MSDIKKLRAALRTAVADYMASEGCSCCQLDPEHGEAREALAKLLNVRGEKDANWPDEPPYYDFSKYESAND